MSRKSDSPARVRLDRWLWAARFYKTRSLAAAAIVGGKVHLAGQRAKRAKTVQVGDQLRIRKGTSEFEIVVRGLSERRGPPSEAILLYQETAESRLRRERLALERRSQPTYEFKEKGKPSKKERRMLERWKRKR